MKNTIKVNGFTEPNPAVLRIIKVKAKILQIDGWYDLDYMSLKELKRYTHIMLCDEGDIYQLHVK